MGRPRATSGCCWRARSSWSSRSLSCNICSPAACLLYSTSLFHKMSLVPQIGAFRFLSSWRISATPDHALMPGGIQGAGSSTVRSATLSSAAGGSCGAAWLLPAASPEPAATVAPWICSSPPGACSAPTVARTRM